MPEKRNLLIDMARPGIIDLYELKLAILNIFSGKHSGWYSV
jgi:hypothetical protein